MGELHCASVSVCQQCRENGQGRSVQNRVRFHGERTSLVGSEHWCNVLEHARKAKVDDAVLTHSSRGGCLRKIEDNSSSAAAIPWLRRNGGIGDASKAQEWPCMDSCTAIRYRYAGFQRGSTLRGKSKTIVNRKANRRGAMRILCQGSLGDDALVQTVSQSLVRRPDSAAGSRRAHVEE